MEVINISKTNRPLSYRFFTSLKEVVSNVFHPKYTIKFPTESVPLPENFRGAPILIDPDICIACGACERNCPSHCIKMTIINEENKEYDLSFNLAQCLYCGVCAENCSKKAINMSNNWLLASTSKESMELRYKVRRPTKKKAKIESVNVEVSK